MNELVEKDVFQKLFRSAREKGTKVELRCSLVVEEIEIDLTSEDDYDVMDDNKYQTVGSADDVDYYCTMVKGNLKKIMTKMRGMDITPFLFLTYRHDSENE